MSIFSDMVADLHATHAEIFGDNVTYITPAGTSYACIAIIDRADTERMQQDDGVYRTSVITARLPKDLAVTPEVFGGISLGGDVYTVESPVRDMDAYWECPASLYRGIEWAPRGFRK